ncbi:MAG: PHP domain-containing protein [Patescibacteria group bacterium]|jgi:putative hydrolase
MLKIDLHIHTVASLHAQSTIFEYVNRAKELGMEVIGISEHGPDLESNHADYNYFNTILRIPHWINGIRLLRGVEANIIDKDGNIDVTEEMLKKLDYVMAGFHKNAGYEDSGKKLNTNAMVGAIRSGKIDIITHPFVTFIFPADVRKISEEACKRKILLEINLSYIRERKLRSDTLENLKTIIKTVKKYKQKLIVNSDSHNVWELGDDSSLDKIKKKIGLTDNLIINNYPKELFKLLNIKM